MSEQSTHNNDLTLWKHYVATYDAFLAAGRAFNIEVKDKVGTLKEAFRNGESRLALTVAELLKPEELEALFTELLGLASYSHGSAGSAQNLILSLPNEWLIANIETYSEPLLLTGDFETYRALLTLYFKIDRNLTRRLAEKALDNDDEDIREAGADFLAKLES